MPYDPQRSHRRPRLADDAAAPIDALLGENAAPDSARDTTLDATSDAPPVVVDEGLMIIEDEIEVIGVGERGRPRLALVAIALVLLLLVVAWVRRRAPKR
jgi:hypothetical protein